MSPAPYSYFRAEGRAHVIADHAAQAQAARSALWAEARARFGASMVEGRFDERRRRFFITGVVFNCYKTYARRPPAGWRILAEKDHVLARGTQYRSVHALPPPGSRDDFYLADLAGRVTQAIRAGVLELAFGSGPMPDRRWPADAAAETDFIRAVPPPGAGPAVSRPDPLAMTFYSGAWYLRVPNDAAGAPFFTPPDAVPVTETEMRGIHGWHLRKLQKEMGRKS